MPNDTFTLPLAADQYANALRLIGCNKAVTYTTHTGPNTGTFTASDIDFEYEYDPGAQQLKVTIVKRHGNWFVNHASVDTVKEHFEALLAQSA